MALIYGGPGVHRGVLRDGAVRGLWVGSEFGVQGSGEDEDKNKARNDVSRLLFFLNPEPRTQNPAHAHPPRAAIRVAEVTKIFGTRTVLDAINLEVRRARRSRHPRRLGVRQVDAPALMIGNEHSLAATSTSPT